MSLILVLVACKSAGGGPTQTPLTPTVDITVQTAVLATPYAQQPAAGICASFEPEMVTVTLNPDIPDPRCTIVRADQILTVLNQTQNTLQITIGRFTASLEPGKETTFDTPFGEYLQPGVHQLQVSPCCGAELWLEVSK
jgi:hypothetical protein